MSGRVRVGSQDGRDVFRNADGTYSYEPRQRVEPVVYREEDVKLPSLNSPSPERLAAEEKSRALAEARQRRYDEREAAVTLAARKKIAAERADRAVEAEIKRLTVEGYRP